MTNSCKAILVFRVPDAIHKRTLFRRNLMMKKDKSGQSDQAQKESVQDSGIDLTVGLSVDPVVSVLRENQKAEERTSDDEKQS